MAVSIPSVLPIEGIIQAVITAAGQVVAMAVGGFFAFLALRKEIAFVGAWVRAESARQAEYESWNQLLNGAPSSGRKGGKRRRLTPEEREQRAQEREDRRRDRYAERVRRKQERVDDREEDRAAREADSFVRAQQAAAGEP
jgi:hypothetical protein